MSMAHTGWKAMTRALVNTKEVFGVHVERVVPCGVHPQ